MNTFFYYLPNTPRSLLKDQGRDGEDYILLCGSGRNPFGFAQDELPSTFTFFLPSKNISKVVGLSGFEPETSTFRPAVLSLSKDEDRSINIS